MLALLADLTMLWADDQRLVAEASAVAVASLLEYWQHWEDQIRILEVMESADPADHVGEFDM